MATVQTLGALSELDRPNWNPGINRTSLSFYDEYNYDYAEIYRTQPNVRTCVDFLARNIAQLGVHVFKRVSDTDRKRLRDHGLAKLLKLPLPAAMKMTRYRLIEALVSDLGIYFNAYWLKLRVDGGLTGLLRIPPVYMAPIGGLVPVEYRMNVSGREKLFSPDEVVHFRGYNPENAVSGLAPLETLRRVLAEEASAGQYREEFWGNSARINGFVTRPKDAPQWSETARSRFLAEFNALYAGEGSGGQTAVLEEGMEWEKGSFNPQESEYVDGRKLTREECARSFHIPLPMVGILDHATFSNISEQHKNLYQDSLGPWLVSIEQDIELQVLPEFEDNENVYIEFNIADKLAGSFEDQIKALQTAIGRPWMTANEGRARQNMPSRPDGDELAVPLNVQVGEPPEPAPTPAIEPPPDDPEAAAARAGGRKKFNSHFPKLRDRYRAQWSRALAKHFRRQESAIVSRVPKAIAGNGHAKETVAGVWFDRARWDKELAADLFGLNLATSKAWAEHTIDQAGIEIDDPEVFEEIMLPWLDEHSRVQAVGINDKVRDGLADALALPDALAAVKDLFEIAVTAWAVNEAISAVTSAANFGSHEAARAGGLSTKTWRVNSGNPRPSHAALNGTTIGIRETFATGQRWPGDPAGGAEENANCECSIEFD